MFNCVFPELGGLAGRSHPLMPRHSCLCPSAVPSLPTRQAAELPVVPGEGCTPPAPLCSQELAADCPRGSLFFELTAASLLPHHPPGAEGAVSEGCLLQAEHSR